jgi:hypothetical protein
MSETGDHVGEDFVGAALDADLKEVREEKEKEKTYEIKFLDRDIRVFLQARGMKVTRAVIDLINQECYDTIMLAIGRCRDNKRVTLMPHDF